MIDDPVDLSPLDPTRDDARFDAMARQLAEKAIGARHTPSTDPLGELLSWTRPALAAAALIAAVSTLALSRMSITAVTTSRRATSADVLGIPPRVADWASTNYTPSPLELVAAIGGARGGGQ
jgi:hypothetical protein